MTVLGLAAFNLLLNAVPAFVLAAVLAWGIIRVLRIPPGRAQLALASLPFVKLAYDLGGGIPERAFFWQRAAGVPRDLGVFQLGVGTQWGLLRVDFSLGALADGAQYPDSAADIMAALLTRRVSIWAPLAIAALLIAVASFRLFARARDWLRAAREARAFQRMQPIAHAAWKGRSFPIYLLDREGSPFSGGLWQGYICFPRELWHSLPSDERSAAIDHELAHLVDRHLVVLLFAGVIEDLFWFVPGMARARRRLEGAIEGAADQWAIDRGCSRLALASALVRVAETTTLARFRRATCSANGASTSARVGRLLADGTAAPRLGCQRPLVRAAVALWAAGSILIAVAFGNH
jgi:beta-lactamase regulating signal transducer with metallopeptidase domain